MLYKVQILCFYVLLKIEEVLKRFLLMNEILLSRRPLRGVVSASLKRHVGFFYSARRTFTRIYVIIFIFVHVTTTETIWLQLHGDKCTLD